MSLCDSGVIDLLQTIALMVLAVAILAVARRDR